MSPADAGRLSGRVSGAAIALAIAILILEQGGYFALPTCVVGVVVCIAAIVTWTRRGYSGRNVSLVSVLLAVLALAYLASAFLNGLSLTTLSETGAWAACAAASVLAASQTESSRAWTLKALSWLGIMTALAGILEFLGFLQIPGGMVDGRLQFTFQYANAAAAWYGAVSLLCLLGPDRDLRRLAPLPVTALFLTQSGGAALVFSAVALAAGLLLARSAQWGVLLRTLALGLVGVGQFAFISTLPPYVGLLAMAIYVLTALYDRHTQRALKTIKTTVDPKLASVAIAIALASAFAIAIFLMPHRLGDALASAAERLCQVRDGIGLWATRPFLGIGPDNWRYLYRYVQTAPYSVAVVHSSLIQCLVDVGLAGAVSLVGACIVGLHSLGRALSVQEPWSHAELAATMLLIMHSVLDFDLQFGSLALMLAFLVSAPYRREVRPGRAVAIAGLVLCLPLASVGVWCSVLSTALSRANAIGAYESTMSLFGTTPLAIADPGAQAAFVQASYALGDMGAAVDAYEHMPAPSSDATIVAAAAYAAMGDLTHAAGTFASQLEATPYDERLLEGALRFEATCDVDPGQATRFYDALARSQLLVGDFRPPV